MGEKNNGCRKREESYKKENGLNGTSLLVVYMYMYVHHTIHLGSILNE